MTKGILYYTDSNIDDVRTKAWRIERIGPWVRRQILKSGLPVLSVSLKPLDFGKNIVLDLEPSVVTMTRQILAGLEAMKEDYIFFCEHDILYHPSHFEKEPIDADTISYNANGWKWDYNSMRVVFHDNMVGLYGLSAYREKLLEHYKKKMAIIYERGYDKIPASRNPLWARTLGYEPGKPPRKGGVCEEKMDIWLSRLPNINIRHRRTITPKKMELNDFVRKPTVWKESTIDKVWQEN